MKSLRRLTYDQLKHRRIDLLVKIDTSPLLKFGELHQLDRCNATWDELRKIDALLVEKGQRALTLR